MKYRLLFLTVMPSPYQRELFQALANDPQIDIKVLYYIERPADRAWDTCHYHDFESVLPGTTFTWLGKSAHWNPGIRQHLEENNYDLVIISDYSSITAQFSMWYLAFARKKWIYWGEKPGMRRGLLRGWIRSLFMLPIKYGAAAVSAIGTRAEEAYRAWLKGKKPVFNIPYFCDLAPFMVADKTSHDRINLLYSGQFIERKGIDTLLRAFDSIADDCPNLDLIMAGGSAEDIDLRLVPDRLKDRVEFAGFVQPEDLPNLFAQADIFVLPSRYDGWGVVINEALGAGLPVIASDGVGAAYDLVVNNENGFIFPAGDNEELARCIRKLATCRELRDKFANASSQLGASFNLDEGVRRWKQVFQTLLQES